MRKNWLAHLGCVLLLFVCLPQLASASDPFNNYHLTLNSEFKATRDGAIGDAVQWVVEKNGVIVMRRNAAGELEYRYFSQTNGAQYRVWLQQYLNGSYQRVSNVVEYTPGMTDRYHLQLSEGYQINRSGNLGETGNLTWVIEMDGNIVLERLASNELDYQYYRNWAGTHFRVWLKQVVNGQYQVVSNTVSYQPDQTEFTLSVDQKYKMIRNGQPGDALLWIVEENGVIIESRDASSEMSYTFVNAQPGARYRMWLQMDINGQQQAVSNVAVFDEPVAYEYELYLAPDYQLKRSGVLGDPVTWVIVKDGDMALQRSAGNEMNYTYYQNFPGTYVEAYLHRFVNGYYQRVSSVVRYKVENYSYHIDINSELQLSHDGMPGESLWWVLEENGELVWREDASQTEVYTYPGNTPDKNYTVWLAKNVDGTLRPVSNDLSYVVPGQEPEPTPEPTADYLVTLNPDYSVSRTGGAEVELEWVLEQNGVEYWRDWGFENFYFPMHKAGFNYRVYLIDFMSQEVVSNVVEYTYVEPGGMFEITLNDVNDVTRSGYLGEPLQWVVEQNGMVVDGYPAQMSMDFSYDNAIPGAQYRIWLAWEGNMMDAVSNIVSFAMSEPQFEYSIELNSDGSISRSGELGGEIELVFMQDGWAFWGMDASWELEMHYPVLPSGKYQVYLRSWNFMDHPEPLSNTLEITFP